MQHTLGCSTLTLHPNDQCQGSIEAHYASLKVAVTFMTRFMTHESRVKKAAGEEKEHGRTYKKNLNLSVTLQFVRLRVSRMALACARRRVLEKKPRDTSTNCRSYRARTEPVFKNERSIY